MKTHLVIHHSLTADSETLSWGAIRRYHVEVNGWRDIGYHFGVELVDANYEMLVGRPVLDRAAAAPQRNMNSRGLHVCFVGNYDLAPPPDAMLEFAAPHLTGLCEALGIPLDLGHVIGHREVYPNKTCPGLLFDLKRLLTLMQGVT